MDQDWPRTLADELGRRYSAGWAPDDMRAGAIAAMRQFSTMPRPRITIDSLLTPMAIPDEVLNDPPFNGFGIDLEQMRREQQRFAREARADYEAMTDEERQAFDDRLNPDLSQSPPLPELVTNDDGRVRLIADAIEELGGPAKWIRRLDEECEARVVRWEHWTGEAYSIEPLARELTHSPKGRRVDNPAEPHELWRFGFDDQNRLVIRREGYVVPPGFPRREDIAEFERATREMDMARAQELINSAPRESVGEQRWSRNAYHVYRADGIDRFEFFSDPRQYTHQEEDRPPTLTRVGLLDGRVEWLEQFGGYEISPMGPNFIARVEFEYDDQRRVRHVRCRSENAGPLSDFYGFLELGSQETAVEADVAWTARGALERVDLVEGRRADGRTCIFRRRTSAEPSLTALMRAIEDAVVAGVPTAVSNAVAASRHAGTPIWCVELTYDIDNANYWPDVWVGFTPDRDALAGDEYNTMWNSAEWALMLPNVDLRVPEGLESTVERAGDLLAETVSWWRVRKTLCSASRRLLDAEWPDELVRTDDFVVVATDIEHSDLDRNVKEILGASGVRALKARGYL